MTRIAARFCALASVFTVAACAGDVVPGTGEEGDSPATTTYSAENAIVGGKAKVTASALNLRSGPSTSYAILRVLASGDVVDVLANSGGWYNVDTGGEKGWCSGIYLTPVAGGNGGGGQNHGGGTEVDKAIARAASGVGFSYHWGNGCWDPNSSSHGACYGSCPNCSHSGQWGADCSGYAAKVWQVPGASAVTSCSHPYSTWNFYNTHDHWSDVSRSTAQRGDAFVHNSNGSGHIFIYDSGDAWGWAQAFECKGCSYGCVHDTRQISSSYKGIRREGY